MPNTMIRSDDTIRAPRSFRSETPSNGISSIPPRAGSPDNHHPAARDFQFNPGSTYSLQDTPPRDEDMSRMMKPAPTAPGLGAVTGSNSSGPRPDPSFLSPEETVQLARSKVAAGLMDTQRSLAGSEGVSDAVKPKLTIDMGHSSISRIPEPMVDVIKDEVERLSLSHNAIFHIPYRFAECAHLRYLNIRANNFREFPKAVYKLPLLEILDLSKNKMKKVPEDIKNLTSLRVFSVMQNRIDELPFALCDMSKLQILKVTGNPLRYTLRRTIEDKEAEVVNTSLTDNEKEVAITAEIKRFLKQRQPAPRLDVESSEELSEEPVETPKPLKPRTSSRFPVIPQLDGTSGSMPDRRSPSFSKPPPIPTRDHRRIASGQSISGQTTTLQRPSVAPASNMNERNRSNSESVLQATNIGRSKRMGIMNRGKADLDTVEETRSYRNSHLRGLSHGSILRTRNPNGVSGGSSSSSDPSSPRERRRAREGFVNRLSALPESKDYSKHRDSIVEGAKSVLFALFQVHPQISTLINVVKGQDSKRNSLEIVFYNASTHVDQLNEALENAENVTQEDEDLVDRANDAVKRECNTCILAYQHVGVQLRNNLRRIVANGDARYVRSLMLMIFGSLNELRNACTSFGIEIQTVSEKATNFSTKNQASDAYQPELEPRRIGSTTPTRDRPQVSGRMRSDTTIVHSNPPSIISHPPPPTYRTPPSIVGHRSRSNSRTANFASAASSVSNTPRSGESFTLLGPSLTSSRINPLTGLDEVEEERIFEKIFSQLTDSVDLMMATVPTILKRISHQAQIAEDARSPTGLLDLWQHILYRCRNCIEVSEALKLRLSNMKLKEPGGGMRNKKEFWQLVTTFMSSFVDLCDSLREPRNLDLIKGDLVMMLRPVQKVSREAGRLIRMSPWASLTEQNGPSSLATVNMNGNGMYPAQIITSGINGGSFSSGGGGSGMSSANTSFNSSFGGSMPPMSLAGIANNTTSPQSVPLPATPLSAALGPAAQATVPSTPASAMSDKYFGGDVYTRADILNSMSSVVGVGYGQGYGHRRI